MVIESVASIYHYLSTTNSSSEKMNCSKQDLKWRKLEKIKTLTFNHLQAWTKTVQCHRLLLNLRLLYDELLTLDCLEEFILSSYRTCGCSNKHLLMTNKIEAKGEFIQWQVGLDWQLLPFCKGINCHQGIRGAVEDCNDRMYIGMSKQSSLLISSISTKCAACIYLSIYHSVFTVITIC